MRIFCRNTSMMMTTTMRNKTGSSFILSIVEDDETLVEEARVLLGVGFAFVLLARHSADFVCPLLLLRSSVECELQLAATVELLEQGCEVADVEPDFLHRGDLRDALEGELVVGVETQLLHFQPAFLLLDAAYLLVNLDEHGTLVKFLAVAFEYAHGSLAFWLRCRLVVD